MPRGATRKGRNVRKKPLSAPNDVGWTHVASTKKESRRNGQTGMCLMWRTLRPEEAIQTIPDHRSQCCRQYNSQIGFMLYKPCSGAVN